MTTQHQAILQVIKGNFLVRTIGHIARIGSLACLQRHTVHDDTNGQAKRPIQGPIHAASRWAR